MRFELLRVTFRSLNFSSLLQRCFSKTPEVGQAAAVLRGKSTQLTLERDCATGQYPRLAVTFIPLPSFVAYDWTNVAISDSFSCMRKDSNGSNVYTADVYAFMETQVVHTRLKYAKETPVTNVEDILMAWVKSYKVVPSAKYVCTKRIQSETLMCDVEAFPTFVYSDDGAGNQESCYRCGKFDVTRFLKRDERS